ncbi:hypothetical protein R1sor_006489 [Riccia sorocarpa]|uniref:Tetratricopeptide repeat protein 33 n=1 Tax=Riccia sorocarpa TaxID=122646 RepID=A0ABD3HMJ8_9MARC
MTQRKPIAEGKKTKAAKMQLVWNKPKKKSRPVVLTPFQFEAAVENESRTGATSTSGGVSHQLEELTMLDSVEREGRANDKLSQQLLEEGNVLAEEGKLGEALGKWETAIFLTPQKALLHEQKAQALLEIGKTWGAVQAATSATQLEPTWTDAWVTLARAQLNYGEPYLAVESARTALTLDPTHGDANIELERAQFLASRQRQATRDSAAMNVEAVALPDGQNRLPSCRRAKVYDAEDIGFGEEHHQAAHRQPPAQKEIETKQEDSESEEKLYDKYEDDDYEWVDEVRKPPLLTDENLLSDFSDI